MIKYSINYLKVKKGSANLITKQVKGMYINISKYEGILIDNIRIADWKDVHSVEWIQSNGYKVVIGCNEDGRLEVEE